jgi:hypothetical protein
VPRGADGLDADELLLAGMVLDGHFTVIAANTPCRVLFGQDLIGVNFVRDALVNPAAAEGIVNGPRSRGPGWTGCAASIG